MKGQKAMEKPFVTSLEHKAWAENWLPSEQRAQQA
jgi:hypothetical protein